LTKKVGVGILTSAHKGGKLDEGVLARLTRSMAMLNRAASEAMVEIGAHACTDVTGFALLGHGAKMASASGVTSVLRAGAGPLFPEAFEHVGKCRTRGSRSNQEAFGSGVRVAAGVRPELLELFWDPQTSGGLFVSVPAERASDLVAKMSAAGVDD